MANCELSFDKRELERADLVLFQGTTFKAPTIEKPDGQVGRHLSLVYFQFHIIFWTLTLYCTSVECCVIFFLYLGLVVVQP